jgi:hypothetical protein
MRNFLRDFFVWSTNKSDLTGKNTRSWWVGSGRRQSEVVAGGEKYSGKFLRDFFVCGLPEKK